jgi:hypothetical protein
VGVRDERRVEFEHGLERGQALPQLVVNNPINMTSITIWRGELLYKARHTTLICHFLYGMGLGALRAFTAPV